MPAETQAHLEAQVFAAAFGALRHEARALQPTGIPAQARDVLPPAAIEEMVQSVTAVSTAVAKVSKPAKPRKESTALAVRQTGGIQPDGACCKNGQVRRLKLETDLTDRDRAYQDAALLLMRALDESMVALDCSARRAAQALAAHIMDASAAPALQAAAVTVYIKPRGTERLGGLAALTARLQKMHGFYQEGCKVANPAAFLVAGRPEKRGINPVTLRAFVLHFCKPNRPTVMQAWKDASAWYASQGIAQVSVDSWYGLEKQLPITVKYRGRMTGAAYKSLLPYVSRDETMFKSNDIWVGDGHTFKARVQSPIHGQAFRPEVTFIIDWRSRKIVGWSVALSENVVAVSDAFRHAQIVTRARPLIYYSDNGSGQTGKLIDHPMTGTLGRQGIAHETGIPGSPQGRGIIERLWASTVIPLAASYPTFLGKQADRDTIRKVGSELEKARRKGEVSRLLPSWSQFVGDLIRCVDDYNQKHSHSGLGGMVPNAAYDQFMDPDSLLFGVDDREIHALWMPEEVREYSRGLIRLMNNHYFCPELMGVLPEGARVRVRFDIHNANTVRILELDSGKFLGLGVWDGHRHAAFPVDYVTDLAIKRQHGIKRRAQDQINRADAEMTLTLDGSGGTVLPFAVQPVYREESLIAPLQDAKNKAGLTRKVDAPAAPREETPDEALMRWYAEEAEQAEAAERELRENEGSEDRLFLMMRAEQDERERQEQEESDRRKAM
ncbi:MAG: Mu transposase C-terminal domain-containing protein [Polaromonas sp.]|nr:Mu transposase C-terminal domain-containing protein [Polaromonas sp.]